MHVQHEKNNNLIIQIFRIFNKYHRDFWRKFRFSAIPSWALFCDINNY